MSSNDSDTSHSLDSFDQDDQETEITERKSLFASLPTAERMPRQSSLSNEESQPCLYDHNDDLYDRKSPSRDRVTGLSSRKDSYNGIPKEIIDEYSDFPYQSKKLSTSSTNFSKVRYVWIAAFVMLFICGLALLSPNDIHTEGYYDDDADDDDYDDVFLRHHPNLDRLKHEHSEQGDNIDIMESSIEYNEMNILGASDQDSRGKDSGFEHANYNPPVGLDDNDPFLTKDSPSWYGSIFVDPPYPSIKDSSDTGKTDDHAESNIGYIQYPDSHNNTIVFCSEGDMYLSTIDSSSHVQVDKSAFIPAMRLTSTVGNVNTPKINPKYPYLVAFTATYTGRREAYLYDLRPQYRSSPTIRLTYMDSVYGVSAISGWSPDGKVLIVRSYSMEVSMEDERLYEIGIMHKDQLVNTTKDGSNHFSKQQLLTSTRDIGVSSIRAIPLSQAIDCVIDPKSECVYFTRFRQSSNTIRYMGGTAEHIWAFCPGQHLAVPLTQLYNGTSKDPKIYTLTSIPKRSSSSDSTNTSESIDFLFFMSDRANSKGPTVGSMNLWAMPLPTINELYPGEKNQTSSVMLNPINEPIQLTSISCQFNGMSLKEYAIDPVTGNVLLRVGADLIIIKKSDLQQKLLFYFQKQRGKDKKKKLKKIIHPKQIPIVVYSDFTNLQERIISIQNPYDVSNMDFFETSYGSVSALMTARGQLFVNPVITDIKNLKKYGGGGMNIPFRRYRVAPGSTTAGMIRIMGSWFIEHLSQETENRIVLILATDPLSPTAELAFYLLDASAHASMHFTDVRNLPIPIIGGHVNGGSVAEGGLGSIKADSVKISPCGRRFAWTDTDGRICLYQIESSNMYILPEKNENGEPMSGISAELTFSPGGQYLAVEHNAKNQFRIITIVDLGEASSAIEVKRIVQVTSSRFNSMNPYFGRSLVDFKVEEIIRTMESEKGETESTFCPSTTLYFLTDRDVVLTENTSPWGTRAPQPYFGKQNLVYALPLVSKGDEMKVNPIEELFGGDYVGGGAGELMLEHASTWEKAISETESRRKMRDEATNETEFISEVAYDLPISFGEESDPLALARRSFLITEIPAGYYISISQLQDDPSFILAEISDSFETGVGLTLINLASFPNNELEVVRIDMPGTLENLGISSNRNFQYFTFSGKTKVVRNTAEGFTSFISDSSFNTNIVDADSWGVAVFPRLEYQQMYSDAWRMLRDYYYDPSMGMVDWMSIYKRYLPLVARCGRREELDDVLKQLGSELSALHVFVYGGEYNDPLHGNEALRRLNEISSLGAVLERNSAKGGYVVMELPNMDPDFNSLDGKTIYSPLTDSTLRMSGQRGLRNGDIIVGVNGESVMSVPDIHMLLRGKQGQSVRIDVIRNSSQSTFAFSTFKQEEKERKEMDQTKKLVPEPVIVVPISSDDASNLRYASWEWMTREKAKTLAKAAGFSIGYMHLRSMSGKEGEDAFIRGFYPDYDKQAMIIDVRHNHGGNIDSWLLDTLQRKAWMYWQGRASNDPGLGWDEQFAFRGHLVVLIDEKTSSDGEGFARGVKELGLGKLVGTRTWGGGIWLSSDNNLVDNGILTAPEIGTYNDRYKWGMGIEQKGVEPDEYVDNNPRETFDGKDSQLEHAINVLKEWLEQEPIVPPLNPGEHQDMSLHSEIEDCSVLED